jgi:aspartate/methionine/tyrosine aminotransferase
MSTSNPRISHKAAKFTESVIRDMTRLAIKYDAINLAQGCPNFSVPQKIKDAACQAIRADVNQYASLGELLTFDKPSQKNTRPSTTGKLILSEK